MGSSRKGVSENQVYGLGKIKLANYFVTIEIYDFSVSEDEVIKKIERWCYTETDYTIRFTSKVY